MPYNFLLIDISEFVLKLSQKVYMVAGSSQFKYHVEIQRDAYVGFLLWFPYTVNMFFLAEEGNSHTFEIISPL